MKLTVRDTVIFTLVSLPFILLAVSCEKPAPCLYSTGTVVQSVISEKPAMVIHVSNNICVYSVRMSDNLAVKRFREFELEPLSQEQTPINITN